MIKNLAERLARFVVSNDESADLEIMTYGFDMIIQEVGIFLLAQLIAIPFGLTLQVLVGQLSLMALRGFAGGAHATNRVVCTITSILMVFGPSALAVYAGFTLSLQAFVVLFFFCITLILIYAPADTVVMPIEDPQKIRTMKILSILTLLVIFGVAYFLRLNRPDLGYVMVITAIIVCCFMHPIVYKMFGCKINRHQEVNQK